MTKMDFIGPAIDNLLFWNWEVASSYLAEAIRDPSLRSTHPA